MIRCRGPVIRGILCIAVGVYLTGCSAVDNPTPISEAQALAQEHRPAGYVLGPGDELEARFYFNPELDTTAVVRPDGRISLPLVPELAVQGRTVEDVTDELRTRYAEELRRPEVSLIVTSFASHRYYVAGQVETPRSFEAAHRVSVLQAITEAGGMLDTSRTREVAIIRRFPDRDPIVVPVNLARVLDGSDTAQDLMLEPQDIVYVPRSDIAEVNRIVDLYIRQNIPIGVGIGIPIGG